MLDAETDLKLVTPIGQALSTLMLLLGGCAIGVPVAIIATGFEDMIAEQAGEEEEQDLYELLRSYDALSEEEKKRFRKLIDATEDAVEVVNEPTAMAEAALAECETAE